MWGHRQETESSQEPDFPAPFPAMVVLIPSVCLVASRAKDGSLPPGAYSLKFTTREMAEGAALMPNGAGFVFTSVLHILLIIIY